MPFIEFFCERHFVLTSILDSYIVFLERTTNMMGEKTMEQNQYVEYLLHFRTDKAGGSDLCGITCKRKADRI